MTKTPPKPETYISVDIEGWHEESGDWTNSIREIGACVVGSTDVNGTFFVDFTKTVTHDGMLLFEAWLSQFTYPIFVSFNSWDWCHVSYYFWHHLGRNPFGLPGRSIDIKVYFMGKFGVKYQDTHKHAVRKLCPTNYPHTHNGLDDAIEQADIFSKMLITEKPQ